MSTFQELLISIPIIIGSTFVLIGSLGLVKLPTLMSRLHAPSKATTLGVGSCLIASIIQLWFAKGKVSIQEVLITVFLFITAPVTAHFIAKAFLHLNADDPQRPPKPSDQVDWSTFHNPSANVVQVDDSALEKT